jgi:hypothetical protein
MMIFSLEKPAHEFMAVSAIRNRDGDELTTNSARQQINALLSHFAPPRQSKNIC